MNDNTVFYAWQSDLDENANRYFIRDAVADAIKQLKRELALEEAIRLDHDTKGVPGSPDIAATIFAKIRECAVFLADVSFVAATEPTAVRGETKHLPNANVLIELGYALATVGSERIVMLMNTAHGGTDKLPFDLKHRRFPIGYQLASLSDPNAAAVKANLRDDLKAAIRVIMGMNDQTADAVAAAKRTEAMERLKYEHQRFHERVISHQVYGFAPEGGIVLLSLLPDTPLSPPLDLSSPEAQGLHLGCIQAREAATEPHERSLVASAPVPNGTGLSAITELTSEGHVFAVNGTLLPKANEGEYSWKGKPVLGVFAPAPLELALAEAVGYSLRQMRKLGVEGTIRCRVELLRIQTYMMATPPTRFTANESGRPYEGDGILCDPIAFDEATDVSTTAAVARVMRPAWDQIWRAFGFRLCRDFDDDGSFNPW